jgi:hypothetical protein
MLTPTTLSKEYKSLQHVFNWTEQDFLRANLLGLEAAFADDGMRKQLRAQLLDANGGANLPA